jgi:hypothetical protein
MGRDLSGFRPHDSTFYGPAIMFNFSANNLTLLSRTECASCFVFVMKDHHTKRVYRLYDFSKSQQIVSDLIYCISGKVNSADKLYLVIESVKTDTKNGNRAQNPNTPDGAGG